MHERIDVALLEKLHRVSDIGERESSVRLNAVPAGLQMRVGENPDDEVRPLLRFPTGWSRENPARQRQKPERRQAAFHKLSPVEVHAAYLSSTAALKKVLSPFENVPVAVSPSEKSSSTSVVEAIGWAASSLNAARVAAP